LAQPDDLFQAAVAFQTVGLIADHPDIAGSVPFGGIDPVKRGRTGRPSRTHGQGQTKDGTTARHGDVLPSKRVGHALADSALTRPRQKRGCWASFTRNAKIAAHIGSVAASAGPAMTRLSMERTSRLIRFNVIHRGTSFHVLVLFIKHGAIGQS
jgi:hypothetical protein